MRFGLVKVKCNDHDWRFSPIVAIVVVHTMEITKICIQGNLQCQMTNKLINKSICIVIYLSHFPFKVFLTYVQIQLRVLFIHVSDTTPHQTREKAK
jgi:hypothetical protein